MVVITGISIYSRLHIYGTCVIFLILEMIFFTVFYVIYYKKKPLQFKDEFFKEFSKPKISVVLLISDFILISFAFFIINLSKRGSFHLYSDYEKILILIYGVWFIASNIAHKFERNNLQNYFYAMAACIKSAVLMVALMSVFIFAFRLFYFSRLQIFGTFLLLIFLEAIMHRIYFSSKSVKGINSDIESVEEVHDFFDQKRLPLEINEKSRNISSPSFMKIVTENCLKFYPDFFDFISDSIDFLRLDDSEISIMSTPDIFNVKFMRNKSIRLLINFHRINDIRWLNRYFLEVHKKLMTGSYFVGRAETIKIYKEKFFKKYPKYYAEVLYILNFIFFRVFPKIPKIRKIYFAMTKGKNRQISRAEVLGRLFFCGFEVLAEREMSGSLFFIAKKAKTPSLDQNPTYGPIVKLKRVGLNGQIISVYKFRTMYPYSEYIQTYIYRNHKLAEGGKINNDFRVTEWGKIMRKYWLDELPTTYNWIKGEVKLFGVRPLSRHYLSLYERHLQEMRKKIKPGIIPPFYADLPRQFNEIIESESKYIQAYNKHPFRTQFIYFWKVLNNILIKGVRSN